MANKATIFGDWGNSAGRLHLCASDGQLIESVKVIGAKDTSDHESLFLEATEQWRSHYEIESALICGAIGSNIGWREVGYIPLPANHSAMLSKAESFMCSDVKVTLLGGVNIESNSVGLPDTLRGEETQSFGWMALTGLTEGLLCMPGTHTKWALMREGEITQLNTGLSGELFEIVSKHSMLTRGADIFDAPNEAFEDGVNVTLRENPPALVQGLMSVRNKQLFGQMEPRMANSYLAGLIIGEDVRESVKVFGASTAYIIGSSVTASHYERALQMNGIETKRHDDQACTLAGLKRILGP